jgi:hypothetical protein
LPKLSCRNLFIAGLFFFAFWLYVVLPFLYTVPRFSHDEATNKCSAEESKNHGFWEKASCDPTAYFTLWLVAFTGVLAVSTIGLWIVTARGVRTQTADTRILQRAYLSVEPGGIHAHNERGRILLEGEKGPQQSVPHIVIQNVGHLPAREIKWLIEHKFSEDRRLDDFPIDEDRGEGRNVLPPGGFMTQGGVIINVGKGPNELKQQIDLFLYVWGIVIYDDGFGTVRRTRFCHRYNCVNLDKVYEETRSVSIGRKIESEFARYHRYGNDAD